MAMLQLQSMMIDTLRENSENEAVWVLRKAFLNQNWNVHASIQVKDHIIRLSQCFVKMFLQKHDYPDYVMKEVYQRSLGLRDNIVKAQHQMASYTNLPCGQSGSTPQTASASNSVNTNASSVIPAENSNRVQLNEFEKGKRKPRCTTVPSISSSFVKASIALDTSHSIQENASVGSWRIASLNVITPNTKSTVNTIPINKATISNNNTNFDSSSNNFSFERKPLPNSNTNNDPKTHLSIYNAIVKKSPNSNDCNASFLQGYSNKKTSSESTVRTPTVNKTPGSNSTTKLLPAQQKVVAVDQQIENPPADVKNEDLIYENMLKLSPIFDMANQYSQMVMLERGCSDPFNDLKTCAASVDQPINCTSNSVVKPDGSKVISCHIFVNDIRLASIVVPAGSNPGTARKKLAEAALEQIRLPFLRVISDGEEGLQLEGSEQPFDEDDGEERLSWETTEHNAEAGSSMLPNPEKTEEAVPLVQDAGSSRIAVPSAFRDFDSYNAWRKETNGILKRIRQLGHMYLTLPHSNNDQSVILKFLVTISGIDIELQAEEIPGTYNLVMDGEILLVSCNADSKEQANTLATTAFFKKVCMPYLCLKSNSLLASSEPFPAMTRGKKESENIIYDNWHTEGSNLTKNSNPPLRFQNFFLVHSPCQSSYQSILKSALVNKQKLEPKTVASVTRKKIYILKMNGIVLGCAAGLPNKQARLVAGENSFNELRKCHWLVLEKKLPKSQRSITVNVLAKCSPKAKCPPKTHDVVRPIDNSNIGHMLLSKMGWIGGGIGKTGSGIVEPITIQMVTKKSGLGFQNVPCPSFNSAVNSGNIASVSDMDIGELIHYYADSPVHRKLIVTNICHEDTERIRNISSMRNLGCKIRGKNKRMVLSRKMNNSILSTLVSVGGKSDNYQLVPPQEIDSDAEEIDLPVETIKLGKPNKIVQCSLINACPLVTFERGSKVVIVRDYVNCLDNKESEGESDNEAEKPDNDDGEDDDDSEDDDNNDDGTLLGYVAGHQSHKNKDSARKRKAKKQKAKACLKKTRDSNNTIINNN